MPRNKSGNFDQNKYIADYMRNKIKQVKVSLNKTKQEDVEMIEWLCKQPEGASGYIKRLIRLDMNEPSLSCHIVYNRVKACHDCNDCGRSPCDYMPDPGETTRINCPLWKEKK